MKRTKKNNFKEKWIFEWKLREELFGKKKKLFKYNWEMLWFGALNDSGCDSEKKPFPSRKTWDVQL